MTVCSLTVSHGAKPSLSQTSASWHTNSTSWFFPLGFFWKNALGTYFYQPLSGNQATDAFIWLISNKVFVVKTPLWCWGQCQGASPIFGWGGPGGPLLTAHPSFLYIKGKILTQSLLRQHETSTLLKCRSKQCHINLSGPKCSMHGCYRCSDHHSPMIFCLAVVNNTPSIISWNSRAWP